MSETSRTDAAKKAVPLPTVIGQDVILASFMEKLETDFNQCLKILKRLEWIGPKCPICGCNKYHGGHAANCELALTLENYGRV